MFSASGRQMPRSHLEIERLEMSSFSARVSWVRLFALRLVAIYLPIFAKSIVAFLFLL